MVSAAFAPIPIAHAVRHGGRLRDAQDSYPRAPTPWLDLSTGINPRPYPVPVLGGDVWTALPDAAAATQVSREGQELFALLENLADRKSVV